MVGIMKQIKTYGIILASGKGIRYRNDVPKQFVKIAGKTVLEHTIEIFDKCAEINSIIVVITPEYRQKAELIIKNNNYKKNIELLDGGETRKESSYIGISSINDVEANVVIHDCARPFLSQEIIRNCINALEKYGAVDVAIPSADTIIEVKNDVIENIPERKFLMRGQTPQCFKLSIIKKAHELAKNDNNFTDDCGLIVKYGLCKVYVVEGEQENIKITYPSDIYLADRIFQIKNANLPDMSNLKELKGKTIVVFGGTSGIGESVVLLAQANGAKTYALSRRTGCDVSSLDQIEKELYKIFQENGAIDYVVNTAGILNKGNLEEQSSDNIKQEIDINYLGSINVTKASIPYLNKSKGAIILFTSSSYTRGRANYSIYSSTKSAIVNFVQAVSEELIEKNIRINAINPERTATPMRYRAFGNEPQESLLDAQKVAELSLKVLLSELTGEVIDVRRANS